MNRYRWILAVAGAAASVGACAKTPEPARGAGSPTAAAAAAATGPTKPVAMRAGAALPTMRVYRSPSCGCCGGWVEHMRRHGFTVDVAMTDDMGPVKKRLGVPLGKGSCHTAEVGGLVIEGHVPAADVKRLLAAPGGARGLVLPGMPLGSPGMESPDGRVQPYTVERVNADGSTSPYARHGD